MIITGRGPKWVQPQLSLLHCGVVPLNSQEVGNYGLGPAENLGAKGTVLAALFISTRGRDQGGDV
jgi:hypothetical protein